MVKTLWMEELKIKDLAVAEISIDPICNLFFYGKRVLRAVKPAYEEQVQHMFDSGMMQELIDGGLFVETWISDVKIEGFNLVMEHKRIEFWNYPYEWSFTMLRDAALVVLDTNKVANKYGYELFDVHGNNMVFDMCKPVYIDFGSFFKVDPRNGKGWSGYLHFYNSFYMPLYLYKKGYYDLSQTIMLFHGYYSTKDLFLLRYRNARLFGTKVSDLIYKWFFNSRRLANARYFKVEEKFSDHKHASYIFKFKKFYQNKFSLNKAFRLMNGLKKSGFDSYWKNYHDEITPGKNARFLRLAELIDTKLTDAKTMIELASNQGKFANFVLENTHIEQMIATDYDKNALDHIYRNNKGSKKVLPLLYDFVRPNGRRIDTNIEERIKADVVMALAVTHHLVLTQDIPLQHTFKVMERLTNKYVIVEFMPLGLYSGEENVTPTLPDFYTLDWFKGIFSDHFTYIHDEKLEKNRHVFIGEIKH